MVLIALLCVVQSVLKPAGSREYEFVFWVIVSLTSHRHATKTIVIVHVRFTFPLNILAIEASVVALDDLGLEYIRGCPPNTIQLRNRTRSPSSGEFTIVEGQHLNIA